MFAFIVLALAILFIISILRKNTSTVPKNFSLERFYGKIICITGADYGLGHQLAKIIIEANCHLILACQDAKKATQEFNKYKKEKGICYMEERLSCNY